MNQNFNEKGEGDKILGYSDLEEADGDKKLKKKAGIAKTFEISKFFFEKCRSYN